MVVGCWLLVGLVVGCVMVACVMVGLCVITSYRPFCVEKKPLDSATLCTRTRVWLCMSSVVFGGACAFVTLFGTSETHPLVVR